MKLFISLFVSNRKDFFREEACIGCLIAYYCACDDVDTLFDVGTVMKQRLIDVGEGVKMSEPVKVERELLGGFRASVFISHKGMLAICVKENFSQVIYRE